MKRHANTILLTAILATAASLVFASTAQAKPTPSFTPTFGSNATYMNALQLRSEGLNEKYAAPTNALLLRSEAMNAKYGLGNFATTRNVGYLRARHVRADALALYGQANLQKPATTVATQASGGFDVREGLIGGAALFATILVVGAAIVLTERRQSRPLSV